MKNLTGTVSFILVLLNSWLFSQNNFNVALQREYHYAGNDLVLADDNLYFLETENSFMYSKIFVCSYTKTGVRRFEKPLYVGGVLQNATLELGEDKTLNVFFHGFECHTPSGGKNYMFRLDTNGNTLSSYTFAINNVADFGFKSSCHNDDSSFTVISKRKVNLLSASGSINTLLTSFDSLTCVNNAGGNRIILSGTSSFFLPPGRHLIIFNITTQNIEKFYSDSSYYIKLVHNKSSWYGLTNQGRINKIDTGLSIVSNSDVMVNYQSGNRVSDFIIASDSIIAGGYHVNSNQSFLIRADTNFVASAFEQDLNAGLKPAAIAQDPSKVVVLHNQRERWETSTKLLNTALTFYPRSLTNSYAMDAAIGGVTTTVTYTNGTCIRNIYLNVTIKNKGTSIIDSLQLNLKTDNCTGACLPNTFSKVFNHLYLVPGDSIVIQTPVFNIGEFGYKCLTITRINGEQDAFVNDNYKCVNLFLLTDVKETTNEKFFISAFPNPANEELNIQLTPGDYECILTDALGQKLFSEKFRESSSFKVDLSNYPEGIYFLCAKKEYGISEVKKILITRP